MKDKGPAPKIEDVEMLPDAWERFERAVKTAARTAPMHRTAAKPKAKSRRSIVKKRQR